MCKSKKFKESIIQLESILSRIDEIIIEDKTRLSEIKTKIENNNENKSKA